MITPRPRPAPPFGVLAVCAVALLLPASPVPAEGGEGGALPLTLSFDSARERSETRFDLADLGAGLPSDWSGHEALVLELRATSSQRVNLKVYSGEGGAHSRVLFHPWPNVRVRAAIPVELLAEAPRRGIDMAAVGNRSRDGYFLSLWGPFVPLTDVRAIAFEMEHPVGSPGLEILSVHLAETSPGDAVLEGLPVLDRLGQYTRAEWNKRARSIDQLRLEWEKEDVSPGSYGYCRYGGYERTSARATGFFRVEEKDGRWWFVDPDGHLFLSVGCDVIQPNMRTRTAGREGFFEALPPDLLTTGYEPRGDRGASFLTWNLFRRFGDGWKGSWVEHTFRRMEAWGLNTVANWSDPALFEAKRRPYAVPLASWVGGISYLGLPDVHSEAFARRADERAEKQCAPRRDDPWLLGYFLANEPPFTQKELQTVDLILEGPESATKRALRRWLAEGDTEERRREFVDDAFDRYVQITSAAVRRHDPNHLNLGMRGGGRPTEAEIRAARAFDAYSVNVYDTAVPPERVRQISELTGKPIIIGEFHFGTPGRGLAASLVQVRDQKQRGVAYRYYVEQAYARPEIIGTHYFQWADQPATGRFDGENYNIGLVDVTDRPYPALVNALKQTHRRLREIHQGELHPVRAGAAVN